MTDTLPPILKKEIENIFEGSATELIPLISTPEAKKVLACSQFVADYSQRNEEEFRQLLEGDDLAISRSREDYSSRFNAVLTGIDKEEDLKRTLRQFRNREMVRIAWRDIAGLAELEETMEDLSLLAEEMLDHTLNWLHDRLAQRFGNPENDAGESLQMVIIAMGKLGAHELNFSSDIDLIFAFPESGQTNGKKKSLDNQEFFVRLGKQLIKAFNEITEDGFVFRMDMRLRPFGESGSLALNFDAMEEYYVSSARDWERYAMIKASIAAGDKEAGAQLMAMFKPFVFRRYLDYSAFEAIREMKRMVDREVLRKGMSEDVKLGSGGIREVEFIGQTFQLLRGGRVPSLQRRRILDILSVLNELELLDESTINELREAYYFLRDTEHRLQEIADQQTQSLPSSELDQARVALGMEFKDWGKFKSALDTHRNNVAKHFSQLLKKPESDNSETGEIDPLYGLCAGVLEQENSIKLLSKLGFSKPEAILDAILEIGNSYSKEKLSRVERERFDSLYPLIIKEVAKVDDQEKTLKLITGLIDSVIHRSVYLTLLIQQPVALTQLVKLFSASPWIADYITQQPILLDDLIHLETLYSPMELTQLEREAERQLELKRVREEDLELRMNQLRQFKHSHVLRVAAADITGNLPVAVVSNYLSAIAEAVVGAAYQLAWWDMKQKYGSPCYVLKRKKKQANFCIIAYGKLGGRELGYGSDLDVVFVHDSQGDDQMTNGKKKVDNSIFFNRLAQRMIHFLTVMTSAGRTYEIDTRLRPSGASGLLVSNIDSFKDYQFNKAWIWEHQALVRARSICGDKDLSNKFEDIRRQILLQERDDAQLKKDVVEMRERMREALISKRKDSFDLKQGHGGITDIEFMVQYNVLRWAFEYPELSQSTDNLSLLETLARLRLMKEADSQLLRDAYFAYRANGHRLALQDRKAVVADTEFIEYQNAVKKIWQEFIAV